MTAITLVYQAAGSPRVESQEPASGLCYWCGQPIHGEGRPATSLSNTFADAAGKRAACPESSHLCAACGWVISDKICLPERVAARMLDKALDGNGRLAFARDGVAERALAAKHGDQILIWKRPKAAVEKRWRSLISSDPYSWWPEVKNMKDLDYWGAYSRKNALSRVGGKFRNFIAYADDSGVWEMYTKAERQQVLARLLEPHQGLWTLAIGDGQKHAMIYAPISDGALDIQSVFLQDHGEVLYTPDDLLECLEAVEQTVLAGATNEEIEAGSYKGRATISWLKTVVRYEPELRMCRGFGILHLALWLRRSVKDLKKEAKDG